MRRTHIGLDMAHTPLWLSHHRDEHLDRTIRLGRHHVCARCLGAYPAAALTLLAQLVVGAKVAWRFDGLWALALLVPALVDWSVGAFKPHSGTNAKRLVTGVLAGLALGRTLYVHLLQPFHRWLVWQLALVTAVALPVIVLTACRRSKPARDR